MIYHLNATHSNHGPWYVFSIRERLFDDGFPSRFKSNWQLICSLLPWIVWKVLNALVFNNEGGHMLTSTNCYGIGLVEPLATTSKKTYLNAL